MLQNPQILARGDPRSVLVPQPVLGQAKAAVGEQVLAIAVVLKGARLPHQLVDDVPIVDRVLVASHQPRQRIDLNSRVPAFHSIGIEPGFDFLADQPAVDRVGVAWVKSWRPAKMKKPFAGAQTVRSRGRYWPLKLLDLPS